MPKTQLFTGFFLLFLVVLVGNAGAQTEPVYAGWTVGQSWDGYGTILRTTDSGKTWVRQGSASLIADAHLNLSLIHI